MEELNERQNLMWIDPQHPIFRPIAVRLVAVAVPLLAGAMFFATGWVYPGAGLTIIGGFMFKRLFLTDIH
ncbi:hypothetical protein [Phaeovulum sp.]|uniref:hypothetical protein n=1 Tax=Phaeovulum sp. TaxID=2934796 RepID=UPI0039E50982